MGNSPKKTQPSPSQDFSLQLPTADTGSCSSMRRLARETRLHRIQRLHRLQRPHRLQRRCLHYASSCPYCLLCVLGIALLRGAITLYNITNRSHGPLYFLAGFPLSPPFSPTEHPFCGPKNQYYTQMLTLFTKQGITQWPAGHTPSGPLGRSYFGRTISMSRAQPSVA